ncbi:MAG: ATP-binding protein [Leptolyngbya sp.]|nr:ATP-binding protein [Leptolyngbya sp.]
MSVPSSMPDSPHSRPDVLQSLGTVPVVMPATASVKAVLAQLGNPAAEGDDAVLLVENERLVGLVSDLDAVRFLASGVDLADPISQHMTQILIQITWDQITSPLDALEIMRQRQIHHLPVVDDQGRPLRMISMGSLQVALTPPNILKLQAVESRTTLELATARPTDSTLSVAQQLAAPQRRCVVVVDDSAEGQTTLVGLVLRQDVLRFQARQLDLSRLPVQTVMREAQLCLQPSDSLWLAYQEMSQRRLPCLVVTTPQRHPLGVITPLDLLNSFDHQEFQTSVSSLWRNFRQSDWDQAELWKTHNAELERLVQTRTRQLEEQLKIGRLLTSLTQRIHEFLDVEDILSTTVDEVRQLLQVDRVVVYQFDGKAQGEVVVESVVPPWPSLLGQTILDECFTQDWAESYRYGRIQAVEDIQRAGLTPCHRDLLAGLTIRANLVVPIVCDDQLWGLLVINQCGQPRRWHDWEVRLMEQLARSVAIAIRQSEYYYRLQADLEARKGFERHLQQINDALEHKVAERTAELQQEVDHRREAEVALAHTNQQLQAMLNAVPAMVSWVSAEGYYLGCNHRLATLTNLTPADFVGQPVGFVGGQSSPFSCFAERFLQGEAETASEETEFSINGTVHHWLLVAQKYDQGAAAVFVGLDVSDRKRGEAEREQAKAALQISETKFRSLVEQTNDWVWELDDQFCFTYINPRATEILGYPASEILGHRFSDFMAEDEAIRFSTILGHLIQQRQPFTQLEASALHLEGQILVLEISGSPIFDAAGDFQGYRGITRDITERKQIELNIRKALTREKELSDLKTRFISMASHEFRTPLTTILASAESLDRYRHKFSPEKQQTILNRIKSSVHHVIGLLNDVLTMNKTEAGKLTYNPTAMDLQQFCQEVIEELQLAHTDSISPLELVCRGDRFQAMADEKLLRHILINLLSNAIKYSPDRQPITVILTCTATDAVFEVKDQGIGIPADDQAQMFEPFHRGNNVGNISGTGLGMVIAQRAAEAHQGQISFTSSVGVGTTFTVTVPLKFLE